MSRALSACLVAVALSATPALAAKKHRVAPQPLTIEAINAAQWTSGARGAEKRASPVMLKAQVLLARAGFSPGSIDARLGGNFQKALRAFQQAKGLETSGKLDENTWKALTDGSGEEVVKRYAIAASDTKGPFVGDIPKDYEKMAELERLAYHTPRELLAEKFHMSEPLLAALNKGAALDRAGSEIIVANVEPLEIKTSGKKKRGQDDENVGTTDRGASKNVRVQVNKSERAVRVFGEDGKLLAYYPASIGSAEKPAPSGTLEVKKVTVEPTYRYDPKYAFKGQKATEPVEVAAGPNNPVGLVWIALSAESYGIHGTPEPDHVSKTESHGCIRLTNWDALALTKLVTRGTQVEFLD